MTRCESVCRAAPPGPFFGRFRTIADNGGFWPGTVCPLLTHKRYRPAFHVAVAKGLCGVGCLAPHFNETRGKVRARGLNVPIKIKKQIRVSLRKNSRRPINILQISL